MRDFGILHRKDIGHHFHHRDLRAEGVVEIGELNADGARADDDHALRLRIEQHRFLAANHRLSVEWQAGQRAAEDAGGDQNLWRGVRFLLSIRAFHLHGTSLFERRLAAEVIDLVLLEEILHAGGAFVGDHAGALDDLAPVEAEAVELESEFLGAMAHQVIKLGIAQQDLGGDAAPIIAGAARPVFLHAGHFFAELRGADGADITRGSAADDDEIVVCHGK